VGNPIILILSTTQISAKLRVNFFVVGKPILFFLIAVLWSYFSISNTVLKHNTETIGWNRPFYSDFSAPSIDANALCFKQMILQNVSINLHLWYTVGKVITWSELKRIYFVSKGAIKPRRVRLTAICVPVVGHNSMYFILGRCDMKKLDEHNISNTWNAFSSCLILCKLHFTNLWKRHYHWSRIISFIDCECLHSSVVYFPEQCLVLRV